MRGQIRDRYLQRKPSDPALVDDFASRFLLALRSQQRRQRRLQQLAQQRRLGRLDAPEVRFGLPAPWEGRQAAQSPAPARVFFICATLSGSFRTILDMRSPSYRSPYAN